MNGILITDKPRGMTSHDVVQRVRRLTSERSVGHLGTLDPMATGVLPLLLGKFTRLAQFFGEADKAYEGTIQFGQVTDTYDAQGEPVDAAKPVAFTEEELAVALQSLTGEIEQMPPPFSAKKIAGVAAYKLARKGEVPELRAVRVHVREFVVKPKIEPATGTGSLMILHNTHYRTLGMGTGDDALWPTSYRFTAVVSSGTYIRSLAHELGQKLGCGAHLASLRRVRSGQFHLSQAVKLEEISVSSYLHPLEILPHLPIVRIGELELAKIRHGNQTNLRDLSPAKLVRVVYQGELIAIATRIAGTLFQPKTVLV